MDLKILSVNSENERGSLVEAFKLPNDGQVFYIVVKPEEMRGNHYHERKTERFLVIWGSAVIQSRDRDSGNVMRVELTGNNPMVATIPPNNTHSLEATEEGAIVLVWVDETYKESDPDTYTEEV